jgi:hypothetical protein
LPLQIHHQYVLTVSRDRCRATDSGDRPSKAPIQAADAHDNSFAVANIFLRSESEARRRFFSGHGPRAAHVLALQRQVGNAVVVRLLENKARRRLPIQRADGNALANVPPAAQALVGTTVPVTLSAPAPLPVPDSSGVGDYPTPSETGPGESPPTVMAYLESYATVQRDDPPHVSGDVAGQTGVMPTPGTAAPTPVSLGLSLIYRNLNLGPSSSGRWELFHEPQIQLTCDTGLTVSVQESIALVNVHWMPPWKSEIELALSGFAQQQLLPSLSGSAGGQLGVEQHLTPWFSVTGTLSGTYTPPTGGQPSGILAVVAGTGVVFNFDGFGSSK